MSASTTSKKQCVTCNKGGGILTCDGCKQSFCGKHVIEHRQDLTGQLDNIMQEHDLLQHELGQPSGKKNSLLKKIDKWEKDSIAKIQTAANTARIALQELLDQSKEQLSKSCRDITEKLRSAREADDFSENDLLHWKNQLKELQSEITSSSSARFIPEKTAPIYLMVLKSGDSSKNQSTTTNESPTTSPTNPVLQERFLQQLGPANLGEDGYLARHSGAALDYAYIRGRYLYSGGCSTTRFKLEKVEAPYRIFFGYISSQVNLTQEMYRSPACVGWFGSDQVYEHGRCTSNATKYKYKSSKIQTDDILSLTIDCDKMKLRLYHERLKTTCVLSVNHALSPLPWQLLMVLCNRGDAVRILPTLT